MRNEISGITVGLEKQGIYSNQQTQGNMNEVGELVPSHTGTETD